MTNLPPDRKQELADQVRRVTDARLMLDLETRKLKALLERQYADAGMLAGHGLLSRPQPGRNARLIFDAEHDLPSGSTAASEDVVKP